MQGKPNATLHQTGHVNNALRSFSAVPRVSRPLSELFGDERGTHAGW